ncbi:hypothetical protein BU15DRAFT_54908 [Melanogaster broomeanus]|nr:hypothetical protein BU15DRAFT_54908 [Melanogaster broomeanus]
MFSLIPSKEKSQYILAPLSSAPLNLNKALESGYNHFYGLYSGSISIDYNDSQGGSISDEDSSRSAAPAVFPSRASRLTANVHEIDPDPEFAHRLQVTLNAEYAQLLAQTDQPPPTAERQVHCGICFDDFPEEGTVCIETCRHDLCMGCARGLVSAKIYERRFPVLCPLCMADHRNRNPGAFSGQLVQLLGVSEEQYARWVELEMSQFSTLVSCRKCQKSTFVDKDKLEATDEVRCPTVDCDHVWCRKCEQSIDTSGPDHSCDGTSELDHLMKEQGWKYCPSCKTPVQKQDGCNHLSCIAPGCNTQFCYRCGVMVSRTVIHQDMLQAKAEHFRICSPY